MRTFVIDSCSLLERDELFNYLIRESGVADCLYIGENIKHLERVAPYLVSPLSDNVRHHILSLGWGKNWGVYVESNHDVKELKRQLRRHLFALHPDGERYYFRYYDPRVMRSFLSVSTDYQAQELFGSIITRFICEDENPEFALIFSLRNGELRTDRRPATEVFPALLEEPIKLEPVKRGPTEEDEKYLKEAYAAAGITPPGEDAKQSAEEEERIVAEAKETEKDPKDTSKKPSGGRRFKFIK